MRLVSSYARNSKFKELAFIHLLKLSPRLLSQRTWMRGKSTTTQTKGKREKEDKETHRIKGLYDFTQVRNLKYNLMYNTISKQPNCEKQSSAVIAPFCTSTQPNKPLPGHPNGSNLPSDISNLSLIHSRILQPRSQRCRFPY